MTKPLKLYGHFDSGHVYKVMLFLRLAKLPYEYESIDIWADKSSRSNDFLQSSRNGEVPCLMIGDNPYIQSNLILQRLARDYRCFGGETEDRLWAAMDWQFWEANRLGMCLPQLRYAQKFAPEEFDDGSLNFLRQRFNQDIQLLSKRLQEGHKFVLDDKPSIADFSLCGYLFWADEAAVELPDPVVRWLEQLQKLDGWKTPYDMMKGHV